MEGCCTIFMWILVISGIIWLWGVISDANAAHKKKVDDLNRDAQQKIDNNISAFSVLEADFYNNETALYNQIKSFFVAAHGSYEFTYKQLDGFCKYLVNKVSEMTDVRYRLANELSKLEKEKNIRPEIINSAWRINFGQKIDAMESRNINRAQQVSNGFNTFGRKAAAFQKNLMMADDSYGKINKVYWDEITGMIRADAVSYISQCENLLSGTDFDQLYAIELNKVLKCVWFFATEKTFSASDFQKATNVFQRIYKGHHSDVIIADLYAKKKMGGEDVLRDQIRELLKVVTDSKMLTRIASALMWMNAYQSENMVLQHMLTSGKEMTAKTQERLHSLTNGGGKAPSGFEVKSRANELYFDVSALAWKDDEYIGLFEKLAFQDKILSYSLALREENKDLFIPQGVQVPGAEKVLSKLNTVFAEEYGSGVAARTVNCIALSGSGEEKMDGILAFSGECKQMGVLIHIARIGKKLIIKFYTLFMPEGTDLAAQKQQALSMYKKLSPTVTMWEGSLKDTMLMAVEQLLNTAAQSGVTHAPAPVVNTDETVF